MGRAVAIPGGGLAGASGGEDAADDACGEPDRLPAQAVISALAAAVPKPSSPSRRNASRRDNSPSTWSVAISSATYLPSGVT